MVEEKNNKGYDTFIEIHKDLRFAREFTNAVMQKFDAFLATQLTLIAKEKGVSIADLCLCRENINTVVQHKSGVVRFWVEVK